MQPPFVHVKFGFQVARCFSVTRQSPTLHVASMSAYFFRPIYRIKETTRENGVDTVIWHGGVGQLPIVAHSRDLARSAAKAKFREIVEKDNDLKLLLDLDNLPDYLVENDVVARKMGFQGNCLEESYAFIVTGTNLQYGDVDFVQLEIIGEGVEELD